MSDFRRTLRHRTGRIVLMLVAVGIWCSALAGVSGQAPASGQYKPPAPPEQPIPFSHKQHVAQGVTCVACHKGDAQGYATLPPADMCQGCHSGAAAKTAALQKLAALLAAGSEIPWVRVYRLAGWVDFSHATHAGGAPPVTCEMCHGDVAQMDVTQKVRDISMVACMACHQERSAPNLCNTCHEQKG